MSAAHVYDDLPALLRGETDRATVSAAAAHLRECADCRDELISALVAHASLASAARFAPELVAMAEPDPDAESNTELDAVPEDDSGIEPRVEPGQLPDPAQLLGPLLAQAPNHGHDSPPARAPAAPRRGFGARWVAAAAVVGIGVGVGGVAVGDQLRSRPSARTVQLAAFGQGTAPATAKIVDGQQVRIDAASLPMPGADRLYEVWLTNHARTRMYAVGSLPAGRAGTFTVAASLLAAYNAIEISVQPLSNSSYSGISVLRGTYS